MSAERQKNNGWHYTPFLYNSATPYHLVPRYACSAYCYADTCSRMYPHPQCTKHSIGSHTHGCLYCLFNRSLTGSHLILSSHACTISIVLKCHYLSKYNQILVEDNITFCCLIPFTQHLNHVRRGVYLY
jgi:hypothetical protein